MTRINTEVMEPRIKQRYWFAASSFSRMYGVPKVDESMLSFCHEWALSDEQAPLEGLNEVDRYFRMLWTQNH